MLTLRLLKPKKGWEKNNVEWVKTVHSSTNNNWDIVVTVVCYFGHKKKYLSWPRGQFSFLQL